MYEKWKTIDYVRPERNPPQLGTHTNMADARPTRILVPRFALREGFEVAVVRPPRAFLNDLCSVFPTSVARDNAAAKAALLCVPALQRSRVDICKLGPEVEAEKDRLLLSFTAFCKAMRSTLLKMEPGCWADYIDPCSAFPVHEDQSASGYSEVDGLQVLLRFRTNQAGACKVVAHPEWGSSLYPATFFTTAAPENVRAALAEVGKEL
jgi:hypothetical protein